MTDGKLKQHIYQNKLSCTGNRMLRKKSICGVLRQGMNRIFENVYF